MLLKYFYDEALAQASYLVGCAKTGEALVIDPARDVAPYLAAARQADLRITHIAETHIHADFVSGLCELSAQTGARMYVSDMGDTAWKYAFANQPSVIPLHDGDYWMVGNIKVEVLHTPGHTPEHLAFWVTDTARADAPIGLFSGDFLFVGDIGRPDLLEAAVGQADTKEIGARQQFQNIQRARQWPDYLQIWPGHGAGSACGKALGAIPSTTLGYEKRFSPAFGFGDDENAFVDWLLNGQPAPPKYFAQMKRVNKAGPARLAKLTPPQKLNRAQLLAALSGTAQVFDLRERAEFSRAHLQGSIGIPASSKSFTTYLGWLVNFNQPIYLIVPNLAEIESIIKALRAIGMDNVVGYGGPEVILETDSVLPTINTQQLVQRMKEMDLMVLDVRDQSEFDELHIANATHIPLGVLPDRLAQIPHDRAVVVQCASGYRSHIASSLLQRFGFDNISSLTDGKDRWSKALMVETKQ